MNRLELFISAVNYFFKSRNERNLVGDLCFVRTRRSPWTRTGIRDFDTNLSHGHVCYSCCHQTRFLHHLCVLRTNFLFIAEQISEKIDCTTPTFRERIIRHWNAFESCPIYGLLLHVFLPSILICQFKAFVNADEESVLFVFDSGYHSCVLFSCLSSK